MPILESQSRLPPGCHIGSKECITCSNYYVLADLGESSSVNVVRAEYPAMHEFFLNMMVMKVTLIAMLYHPILARYQCKVF